MSTTDILDQLPKLNSNDRMKIFSLLYDIEEQEIISGILPSTEEKLLLDRELENYHANPHAGSPWDEVKARIFLKK